ncbi:amidohydrolase [Verticiella sediminum]|uniref:Amidohydrolase n=1 Tax=Verticiella sediminum TaxID=1247510 RepID=A0A556AIU1_9BURK|nr:M20 aminoacylase family protein [Verticiella sediminum]TSH92824.1 amidohydrolase [Verticiella sediminum]
MTPDTARAIEAATELLCAPVLERMRAWRHDFHAHPETAFEEHRTAQKVAEVLQGLGLEIHRGLGGTGVVGTLRRGDGPVIGLRADMDALDMQELGTAGHCSTIPGKMHGCGHDGHTAMLLGAAQRIVAEPGLRGTVHFIFQPAEENYGGARVMLEDGLFEQFPCERVFALHNAPNLPLGTFAIREGAMLSSSDTFEIRVIGRGSHAAQPEAGIDAVVTASTLVGALQGIVSRNISAVDSLVLSITQIHGGDTWNVIPEAVTLRGTCRCFSPQVRQRARMRIDDICAGVAQLSGARIEVDHFEGYPACVNSPAEAGLAAEAARAVVGADAVNANTRPRMGSEDFAYMLERKPGAYILVGAAREGVDNPPVHNPYYDFNDDILALGAAYWVTLTRNLLGADAPDATAQAA